jgi:citrate synthase
MYHHVNMDSSINMREKSWMTAADAARTLRVSRATLYAYVSRGLVRSQATPGATRERAYAREDIEHLRRRTEERRAPDKAAARALRYGLPVLESAISLIDGRHIYYRGHDAIALARTGSLREVASLIWTGGFDRSFAPAPALHKAVVGRATPQQSRHARCPARCCAGGGARGGLAREPARRRSAAQRTRALRRS